MICIDKQSGTLALLGVVGVFLLSGTPCLAKNPSPSKTKTVRQANGQVVKRLVMAGKTHAPPAANHEAALRMQAWLESASAPRPMTALALVPGSPEASGRHLTDPVDPTLAMSWAEFIDPALNTRAQTKTDSPALTNSIWRYTQDESRKMAFGVVLQSDMRGAPWVQAPASTTWRSVVLEGAKRALNGQQSLQEWLSLPTPDPKANPWLSTLGSYRY